MSILEAKGISLSFDNKKVLENFDFYLEAKEHVALMGASGVGKTTFLRLIAGLNKSFSGKFNNNAKKISYQFQEARLIPQLTALENVMLVMDDKDKEASKRRALYLLEKAGIKEAVNKIPSELSGGMKKRVSLVRALAYGGDLFLFDEPFESLDADTAAKMLELIKCETEGAAVIMVTHSEEQAKAFGGRIARIY